MKIRLPTLLLALLLHLSTASWSDIAADAVGAFGAEGTIKSF